jgi:hypothetical protein
MIQYGWSLAEQGEGAEGAAQIRQGMATFEAMGAQGYQPYHLVMQTDQLALK